MSTLLKRWTTEQCERMSAARRLAFAERIEEARAYGWIGTAEALRMLPCLRETLCTLRKQFPNAVRVRSAGGASPRGAGLLFWRADVERLAAIRRRAQLRLSAAFAVLEAIKTGGPL